MEASSKKNASKVKPPVDTIMTNTEETITTTPVATKTTPIAKEMDDFSLRYEIPVRRGDYINDHLQTHIKLLQVFTTTFPATELYIVDKRYLRISDFENKKWREKEHYDIHFDHEVNTDTRTTVITHIIRSSHPIVDIMGHATTKEFLTHTGTILRIHPIMTELPEIMKKEEMETDDISVATIPSGRPPKTINVELVEIYIRHEISSKNDTNRGPHLRHSAVLQQMEQSFPDDIEILNNRNKIITLENYESWTDLTYHNKHFDVHTVKGKGARTDRHYIVHRIRTTLSLSTLRNDRRLFRSLQENNVFLRRHYFREDEWNTVNLGFILFLDPSKHLRDEARQKVLTISQNTDEKNEGDGMKFQLVAGTPFMYLAGRRMPTKAYTVVCLRQHANDVDDMLKKAYRHNHHYVKFRLRHKNIQAFGQAIQAQNNYLSTLRTIPIVGISNYMMPDLEHRFRAIDGVSDVVRSTKTEVNGRWNILTDEKHFHTALKFVRTNLNAWLEQAFNGHYDRPDDFPNIQVTANVADDDSSTGGCSYLSTSAISYGSYDTTGSCDFHSSAETDKSKTTINPIARPTSYAAAATQNTRTPQSVRGTDAASVSDMTSPATVPIDYQQKLEDLEGKVRHYQGLEAKLDRLEKILEALIGGVPKGEAVISPNNVVIQKALIHEEENMERYKREARYEREQSSRALFTQPNEREKTPPTSPKSVASAGRESPEILMPEPSHSYDANRPQHLYSDNGDGSLFSVGIAGPSDFYSNGVIHGPRPSRRQIRGSNNIQSASIATHRQIIPASGDGYKLSSGPKQSQPKPIQKETPQGSHTRMDPPTPTRIAPPEQLGFSAINTDAQGIGWKKVEKRGKRTADTANIGDFKRPDVRDTPTKIKIAQAGLNQTLLKPMATKSNNVYNPYKDDSAHDAVRLNRPSTWKNTPSKQIPRGEEQMEFQTTPLSPDKSLLAEEAKHHC